MARKELTAAPRRLVEVALPIPLFRNFIYAVNGEEGRTVAAGSRLLVPLRGGKGIGVCVATDVAPPARGTVKDVLSVPDPEPVVSAEMMDLCRWMSEYYVTPLGICLRSALPAALGSVRAVAPRRKRIAAAQHWAVSRSSYSSA